MKKLVFMFAAFTVISFASCGLKTSEGPVVDTDTIIIEHHLDSVKNVKDSISDSTKVATDTTNVQI